MPKFRKKYFSSVLPWALYNMEVLYKNALKNFREQQNYTNRLRQNREKNKRKHARERETEIIEEERARKKTRGQKKLKKGKLVLRVGDTIAYNNTSTGVAGTPQARRETRVVFIRGAGVENRLELQNNEIIGNDTKIQLMKRANKKSVTRSFVGPLKEWKLIEGKRLRVKTKYDRIADIAKESKEKIEADLAACLGEKETKKLMN